jgi:hypothetical protein
MRKKKIIVRQNSLMQDGCEIIYQFINQKSN